MANPVTAAGAQSDPTKYGALNMGGEQFTGLWTQRSPYRDAATAYLVKKFYQGSRFDSIWDGYNREICARLTDVRRPGNPVWNASTFGPIGCFYSFKFVQAGATVIRVMADTATAVYDVTDGGKVLIWTKSAGAGRTRFLAVGPTLYMANGVDNVKWIRSGLTWTAATTYTQGQFIVDTYNNLQLAVGSQTATITNIAITSNVVTLFLDQSTPLDVPLGTYLTFAGLSTVPALNTNNLPVTSVENGLQLSVAFTHADVAFSAETGTVTTGLGATGGMQPAWEPTLGAITLDNTAQWENRGSSVQQWMYNAPTVAPTVTQAPAPEIYPAWVANTWYGNPLVIIDSNGNVQQLTTSGTTGSTHPTWATVKGTTTADNTAVWTCLGGSGWSAGSPYTVGQVVQATFTYYITTSTSSPYPPYYTLTSTPVTVTLAFQCTVGGVSGLAAPAWTAGTGTTVTEATGVTWINIGMAPTWPANALVSDVTKILDTNGNIQQAQYSDISGATTPAWNVTPGAYTGDDQQNWLNLGPYSPANTGPWIYAYSGLNSITGDITTASPLSQPILVTADNLVVIQGQGVQATFDQIILWRTTQGESVLLYDAAIPNPGPGQTWIFTDTTPDTGLNAEIEAPVADSNNAPPVGMTAPAYHLERIWAIDGENVVYSGGPDTIVGNGNDAFPPLNFSTPPAAPVKLRPITVQNGGLLVYTTSGIQIILGTGAPDNPFYMTSYCDKVNLASYDVEDILGTQLYIMESNLKVSTLQVEYPFNPQSGYSEVGFPIGDQFKQVTTGGITSSLYTAAGSYLSWNIASSGDTAMYVADGAVGWFRMSSIATPESGLLWSPRAGIVGGTSAVQSIETSPGIFNLLIGPETSGPILARDTTGTVFSDAGTGYEAWDAKGVNLLCPTGQTTEVVHVSTKSAAVGARPAISILMGEIQPTTARPWNPLLQVDQDPPKPVPKSESVFSDRYKTKINGASFVSDCILVKFDYGAQTVADELMDWGIYATTEDERKEQAARPN